MKKQILVISIILLLLGVACAPTIFAKSKEFNEEKMKIEISYFTMDGIQTIEKYIPKDKANNLLVLMDGFDFKTVSYELNQLNLIPEDMDIQQAEDLLNGDYGINNCKQLYDDFKPLSKNLNSSEENFFSIVGGSAVDNEMFYVRDTFLFSLCCIPGLLLMVLDSKLSDFPWYPSNPYFNGPLFWFGAFFLYIGLMSYWIFHINPFKPMGLSKAILEDTSLPPYNYPNVNTYGVLGQWLMSDLRIELDMIGFLGVWINYDDGIHNPACQFNGFALYINARGENT